MLIQFSILTFLFGLKFTLKRSKQKSACLWEMICLWLNHYITITYFCSLTDDSRQKDAAGSKQMIEKTTERKITDRIEPKMKKLKAQNFFKLT